MSKSNKDSSDNGIIVDHNTKKRFRLLIVAFIFILVLFLIVVFALTGNILEIYVEQQIVRSLMPLNRYIHIEGTIQINNPENIEKVSDIFIQLMEENKWFFGGGFKDVDEEGNDI
ncbi:hypothetical protein [Cohnella soli]|uniref:Uncharacterized protein n=1 Tax=Cohnella soli TaxID=425005 RepID=A0ABW0HP03_9BACL